MSAGEGVTILQGDCRETLKALPAESVHCCVTSPPYWGLRDYGTGAWEGGEPGCDHLQSLNLKRDCSGGVGGGRDLGTRGEQAHSSSSALQFRDTCGKCGARRVDRQIGLEPTPEAHIAALLEVFREVWRVLRKDGQLWLNYGDCYACAPNGRKAADIEGDDRAFRDKPFSTVSGRRNVQGGAQIAGGERFAAANLKPKDLVGMPWRVALALQADGWWLRSDIIWSKRNPMPESVTDRPTRAHEYLFLLAKAERYFYDADAIREKWADERNGDPGPAHSKYEQIGNRRYLDRRFTAPQVAGRNKRTVWEINTQPTPEAHFATFPEALVEPCIMAGTSEWGCCPECGAPWARVTEARDTGKRQKMSDGWDTGPGGHGAIHRNGREKGESGKVVTRSVTTGWRPTCRHPYTDIELVPAVVLDPFAGSGTVGRVASRLGRRSLLCELNPEYIDIAHRRTAQRGLEL